jgi:CO/xanthine dehydrogenase Mo-binding subunit
VNLLFQYRGQRTEPRDLQTTPRSGSVLAIRRLLKTVRAIADHGVPARGDVGAEMAAAPVRVGGRFRFHRKTPVAIENRACLAEYDRGRRSLTLTVSTQIPGIIRDLLVDLLRVPGHSVRVVAPDVGGGLGGKASVSQP